MALTEESGDAFAPQPSSSSVLDLISGEKYPEKDSDCPQLAELAPLPLSASLLKSSEVTPELDAILPSSTRESVKHETASQGAPAEKAICCASEKELLASKCDEFSLEACNAVIKDEVAVTDSGTLPQEEGDGGGRRDDVTADEAPNDLRSNILVHTESLACPVGDKAQFVSNPTPSSALTYPDGLDRVEDGTVPQETGEEEELDRLQRCKERMLAVYFGSVIRGETAELAASTWLAKNVFDGIIAVQGKHGKGGFHAERETGRDNDGRSFSRNETSERRIAWSELHSASNHQDRFKPPSEAQLQSLPVGVFYSPFKRCLVSNWRDSVSHRQIKVNFRPEDYGFELARGLAIVARHLRCSDISKIRNIYEQLCGENMCLSNDKHSVFPLQDPDPPGFPSKFMAVTGFGQARDDRAINWPLTRCSSSSTHVANAIMPGSDGNHLQDPNIGKRVGCNTLTDVRVGKRAKKLGLEKEQLPTGVFLYNGSYCANWWDRKAAKQVKVNFKIDGFGVERARQMAILSRESRCSCVSSVEEMYQEWKKQRVIQPRKQSLKET